jgi:hypothetical protein
MKPDPVKHIDRQGLKLLGNGSNETSCVISGIGWRKNIPQLFTHVAHEFKRADHVMTDDPDEPCLDLIIFFQSYLLVLQLVQLGFELPALGGYILRLQRNLLLQFFFSFGDPGRSPFYKCPYYGHKTKYAQQIKPPGLVKRFQDAKLNHGGTKLVGLKPVPYPEV